MYPMHKLAPTPFGTYLLYMDNAPKKYKVEKWPFVKPTAKLPAYNQVKEYGRRNKLANNLLVVQAYLMNEPKTSDGVNESRRYAPIRNTQTAEDPIWKPRVKTRHRSYNMRYLRHNGQPLTETPADVVRYVDDVTGADVTPSDDWYRNRSRLQAETDTSYRYSSRLSTRNLDAPKESRETHQHSRKKRHHRRKKCRYNQPTGGSLPSVFSKSRDQSPVKKLDYSRERSELPSRKTQDVTNTPHFDRGSGAEFKGSVVSGKVSDKLYERLKTGLPSYEKSCFPAISSPAKDPKHKTTGNEDEERSVSRASTASTNIKSRMSRARGNSRLDILPSIPENVQRTLTPSKIRPQSLNKTDSPKAVSTVTKGQKVEYKNISPTFPSHLRRNEWDTMKMEEQKKHIVTGRELLPFKWEDRRKRSPPRRKSAVVDTTDPEIVRKELEKFRRFENSR